MATSYNFLDVALIVGGFDVTGFGEGSDVINFEFQPPASTVVGADGHLTRIGNSDKSFTLTIRLASTSSSNRDLESLSNGPAFFSIAYTDESDRLKSGTCVNACFVEVPNLKGGNGEEESVWVIRGERWLKAEIQSGQ